MRARCGRARATAHAQRTPVRLARRCGAERERGAVPQEARRLAAAPPAPSPCYCSIRIDQFTALVAGVFAGTTCNAINCPSETVAVLVRSWHVVAASAITQVSAVLTFFTKIFYNL